MNKSPRLLTSLFKSRVLKVSLFLVAGLNSTFAQDILPSDRQDAYRQLYSATQIDISALSKINLEKLHHRIKSGSYLTSAEKESWNSETGLTVLEEKLVNYLLMEANWS